MHRYTYTYTNIFTNAVAVVHGEIAKDEGLIDAPIGVYVCMYICMYEYMYVCMWM